MISILCPTRHRPDQLNLMVKSARATALVDDVEFVLYVDDNDAETQRCTWPRDWNVIVRIGPRIEKITDAWNKCMEIAKGDIFMQGNDDVIFRTAGWDVLIRRAIESFADRIVMAHADNGQHEGKHLATHPFVHRRWTEILGYFIPPWFAADYGDSWLNELADYIGRRVCVPALIEHMHYGQQKASFDQTYAENIARLNKYDCAGLWNELEPRRKADAEKLRAAMMKEEALA